MPILFHDFETRSTLDLKSVGSYRYSKHPTTDVWCCAYAVDDGPVQIWVPGDPVPPEFIEAANNPEWTTSAHNDQFERLITTHIMAPRYGWPIVPIERRRCPMAAALALALPGKLEMVAEALNLKQRKDAAGHKLMLKMAKPRKPRPDEDPDGVYWIDDAESLEQLKRYNKQDVEVDRELHYRLRPLIPEEQVRWQFDALVNDRGFAVDRDLAKAMVKIAETARLEIDAELEEITGGAVTAVSQTARLTQWLGDNGCPVDDIRKGTLSHALRRKGLAPEIVRVLELRQAGAHAAAAKPTAFLDRCDDDGRVRGAFIYHGASTGRWSSLGVQVQNLKRAGETGALEAVATGDIERVREVHPQPMAAIGSLTRALVWAQGRFMAADFSGIESRITAWLAGETWKIEQWRKFDQTGDPNDEPYLILGRMLGVPEDKARLIGKIADLAFGFMGGEGAWRAACKMYGIEDNRTEDGVRALQQAWRKAHPKVARFWALLDSAAIRATRTPGRVVEASKLVSFRHEDGFLFMRLPSGRELAYPFARLMRDDRGNQAVTFMDLDKGRFIPYKNGRKGAYGGVWIENAVQATARDIFAEAMPRLEAAGYPVVFHVHDEIVAEVPVDSEHNVEDFVRIITEAPAWADGLPVAAKGWSGPRFLKTKETRSLEKSARLVAVGVLATSAEIIKAVVVVEEKPPWLADEARLAAGGTFTAPAEVIKAAASTRPKKPQGLAGIGGGFSLRRTAPRPDETAQAEESTGANGYDKDGYTKQKQTGGTKEAEFIYRTIDGAPYLRVDKMRRPDGKKYFPPYHLETGRWILNPPSGPHIPYRLPELAGAKPSDDVYVCSGEKDADTLAALGLIATTNPGGEIKGAWTSDLNAWFVGKRRVFICEDNDDTGRKHTREVAAALASIVPDIRVIAFPELPEHGDVTDWINQGHTKEEFLARAKAAPKADTSQASSLKLHWFDDDSEPDQRWLIHGLLPETGSGLVSGQWGAYKSTAALDIAAAIMTGTDFIERSVMRKGGVLYFAAEGGSGIKKRMRAVLESKYPDIDNIPFVFAKSCPLLLDKKTINILADTAKLAAGRMAEEFDVPLVLIFIDTVAAAAGYAKPGDENDAAVGQAIMNCFTELSRRTGALVLGVDHFGKLAETGTRGSSAKESAADVVLALLGDKSVSGAIKNTRMAVRKVRDGEGGYEIAFGVQIHTMEEFDNDGRPRTAPVIDWKPEVDAAEIATDAWPESLRPLRQAMVVKLANGDARELFPHHEMPAVRAIDLEVIREEFYATYPAEGDAKKKQETRRKAFGRALKSAQEKGLVGVREVEETTFIWIGQRDKA
jgi:DNA polymerase bacteriophage-type